MKKQPSNTRNKRKFYNLRKYSREVCEELVSNDDLLREIFFRVPAKQLIRFKCVSKHWLSLISDPKFCSDHTLKNITSSVHGVFFKSRDDTDMKYVSLSKEDTSHPLLAFQYGPGYTLKHVSYGIALYSNILNNNAPLVVYNITTRQRKALPERRDSSKDGHEMSCFVFLDPIKSFHYQVIVVIAGPCYEIDVYSSETQSWKYLNNFNVPTGDPFTRKVLCNGAIHWITSENVHARFEINEEKLIANRMPPEPKFVEKERIGYFGECDESLFLIVYAYRWPGDRRLKIFEMDKDYCHWTVKSPRISTRPLIYFFQSDHPRRIYSTDSLVREFGGRPFLILCFLNRGIGNGIHLLLALNGKLVFYSLLLKEFDLIPQLPGLQKSEVKNYENDHAYPFLPTLISLN